MEAGEVVAAVDAAIAGSDGWSGVVRVDVGEATVCERAVGLADRARGTPVMARTVFGWASGTKTLTALTVLRLVEDGVVGLDTTARALLGVDLPLVDDAVTVEHLLGHRSGIGDYVDEDLDLEPDAYVLDVPVHRLQRTDDYLAALDGRPAKFAPGTAFSYSNSGYVVLALLAERAAGEPFASLVQRLVCDPAGMAGTRFRRSDEPDGDTAVGYLGATGPRTNVLHLPVVGSGDGGISGPVGDVHALWRAIASGRIVTPATWAVMTTPHGALGSGPHRYGWGVWLVDDPAAGGAVQMEGADAGVSFRSVWMPGGDVTWTVVSNTSDGAWPVARALRDAVG